MALLERFKHAVGVTTREPEPEYSQRTRLMERSADPSDRFGAAVAAASLEMTPEQRQRVLPVLGVDPTRIRGESTTDRIAIQARDHSRRYIEHGSNNGMGAAIGKASREYVMRNMGKDDMLDAIGSGRQIGTLVEAFAKGVADNTMRYLEIGAGNEAAMDRTAQRITDPTVLQEIENRTAGYTDVRRLHTSQDKATWLRDALATETAMARAGALSASTVVNIANQKHNTATRAPSVENDVVRHRLGLAVEQPLRHVPIFHGKEDVKNPGQDMKTHVNRFKSSSERAYPAAYVHLDPKEIAWRKESEARFKTDMDRYAASGNGQRIAAISDHMTRQTAMAG